MPMGMPYAKGANMNAAIKPTMSELMGVTKNLPAAEGKEHGKTMRNMKDVMSAETKEYGKRPASKMALAKTELKEHSKGTFPMKKKK